MLGIRKKVARTAKRAGLLSGGLLLCTVGTGFLTVAAWFALLPSMGVALTALIIAGAYIGVGFICFGLASGGPEEEPEQVSKPTAQPSEAPPILQAFMYGLQAGARADQARR